ncbi:MAG: Rab family GTPase [Promethearchaeota archaeon]
MDNIIKLKLVVLGEGEVGKTSTINAYLGHEIPEVYLPTIGNITHKKDYKLKESEIKLSIWDAGGQRSFNPLNPALYSNIDIVLLVFDLTKPKESLKNIKGEFLENINSYSEDVLTLIVGNKLDLLNKSSQLKTALKEFLTEKDNLILISAKTGENVTECFELLIYTYLRKAEILYPDLIKSTTIKEFERLINKNEKQLKRKLVNIMNIDSSLQDIKPKSIQKKEELAKEEDKDLKYYKFLKDELEKNESQKNDVFDLFLINVSEINKTIKHLYKTYSKTPEELIRNIKEFLITSQKEFEDSVEVIKKLNREEFELVRIISKTKSEIK